MTAPAASTIRFGRITVLPAQRRVLLDGHSAPLGARAFDLLQALLARQGEIVSKKELLDTVWPGVVVEENNLQVQICALRKLLGQHTIVTVPGRGYSFSGTADVIDGAGAWCVDRHSASAGHAGRTPLRGRDDELAALVSLLHRQRLVTVAGPGGVGKSRLVQAALGWQTGDATSVELDALPRHFTLPAWIARAFGLEFARPPQAQQVASAIAGRSALLVVENAECCAEAFAEFAEALLDHAADLKLVCTSQVPLKAQGEHVLRLAPLPLPASDADATRSPAVQLLSDALSVLQPQGGFMPREEHDAAAICRHLEGIPLAIELAAARIALLGMASVRRMLAGDRFRLLTSGGRRPARQRSLLASMEWSWNLLTARERQALSAVARYPGRFTLAMARHALGPAAQNDWDVVELLASLVDKSLVVTESGSRSVFRLLETTRLFAQQRAHQPQAGRSPCA